MENTYSTGGYSRKEDIFLSWRESRLFPMERCPNKFILTVERLNDELSQVPLEYIQSPGVCIRLAELVTESGKNTTSNLLDIKDAGGIHHRPRYNGLNVVLSSIAKDKTWLGLSPKWRGNTGYLNIINAVKPDYCFSSDGETYGDDPDDLVEKEMGRMLDETECIKNNCPDTKVIALVKGKTLKQTTRYIDSMKDLGINLFAYYIGDSLYKSPIRDQMRIKKFALEVAKRTSWLLIYGGGSYRTFTDFNANAYATMSPYLNAVNGEILNNRRFNTKRRYPWEDRSREARKETIKRNTITNLNGLYEILASLESRPQKKISNYMTSDYATEIIRSVDK